MHNAKRHVAPRRPRYECEWNQPFKRNEPNESTKDSWRTVIPHAVKGSSKNIYVVKRTVNISQKYVMTTANMHWYYRSKVHRSGISNRSQNVVISVNNGVNPEVGCRVKAFWQHLNGGYALWCHSRLLEWITRSECVQKRQVSTGFQPTALKKPLKAYWVICGRLSGCRQSSALYPRRCGAPVIHYRVMMNTCECQAGDHAMGWRSTIKLSCSPNSRSSMLKGQNKINGS